MAVPFVLTLLLACDPHDAEVNASYAVYLGEGTSPNVIYLRSSQVTKPCAYEKTGEEVFDDDCYAKQVKEEEAFAKKLGATALDCRNLQGSTPGELRDARLKGFDYEANCCEESLDDDGANDPDGSELTEDDCTPISPVYFDWLDDNAYYVVTGKADSNDADTYREEVVLTSEGDLQMTVHTHTTFGDFRFGWVIDPKFQPQTCTEDENGKTTLEDVDGDWIAGWSGAADSEGWTTVMLNTGASQQNPSALADTPWYFDDSWDAGVAFGRMENEEFYQTTFPTDYADTHAATADAPYGIPLWVGQNDDGSINRTVGYGSLQGFSGDYTFDKFDCLNDCNGYTDYADFYAAVHGRVIDGGKSGGKTIYPFNDEFERYGQVSQKDVPVTIQVEDNSWRPAETDAIDHPEGLNGWVGIAPSYVRFKGDVKLADLKAGKLDKPLEGEFQLYRASVSTSSKMMIHGSFTINNIAEDVWGKSDTLEHEKRVENKTPTCGE